MTTSQAPLSLDHLTDRLEQLLARYQELQHNHDLLQAQLQQTTQERDSYKSRLAAARARVDALLKRMPATPTGSDTAPLAWGSANQLPPTDD